MDLTRRGFLRGAVALGASWVALGARAWSDRLDPDEGEWIPGDLHCHTIFSPDVASPEETWRTLRRARAPERDARVGLTPGEQIATAVARGLVYLAITDHNSLRALKDPAYEASPLVMIPGYEHSLERGHVGLLGVTRRYGTLRGGTPDALELRRLVHRAGGLFIPTHPFLGAIRWGYPNVRPDALELWNGGSDLDKHQRRLALYEDAYLRRWRVPLVGGSDNHWRSWLAINGVGQPTTWVRVRRRSPAAVLTAIRAGRTTVSAAPPSLGGATLVIQAEHGSRRYGIGDVAPRRPLWVTAQVKNAFGLWARLIVDGRPRKPVQTTGPEQILRWRVEPDAHVRAELVGMDADHLVALTSPIWVGR